MSMWASGGGDHWSPMWRGWLTTSSLETLDVLFSTLTIWQWFPLLSMLPPMRSDLSQTPFPVRFWISFRFSQQVVTWEAEGRGAIHPPAIEAADRSVRRWDFSVFGQALHPFASHWPWAGGQRWFQQGSRSFLTSSWQQQHLKLQVFACAYDLTTSWQLPNFQFFQQFYKHAIHIIL